MIKKDSNRISKIIENIKIARGKDNTNYKEHVSINVSFTSFTHDSSNVSKINYTLFLGSELDNKYLFDFKSIEELEEFAKEKIKDYGIRIKSRATSKNS